jgi:hypothetical protein
MCYSSNLTYGFNYNVNQTSNWFYSALPIERYLDGPSCASQLADPVLLLHSCPPLWSSRRCCHCWIPASGRPSSCNILAICSKGGLIYHLLSSHCMILVICSRGKMSLPIEKYLGEPEGFFMPVNLDRLLSGVGWEKSPDVNALWDPRFLSATQHNMDAETSRQYKVKRKFGRVK